MRAAAVVYVKDLDRVAAFYAGPEGNVVQFAESDPSTTAGDG
jgi:hypothetical protein